MVLACIKWYTSDVRRCPTWSAPAALHATHLTFDPTAPLSRCASELNPTTKTSTWDSHHGENSHIWSSAVRVLRAQRSNAPRDGHPVRRSPMRVRWPVIMPRPSPKFVSAAQVSESRHYLTAAERKRARLPCRQTTFFWTPGGISTSGSTLRARSTIVAIFRMCPLYKQIEHVWDRDACTFANASTHTHRVLFLFPAILLIASRIKTRNSQSESRTQNSSYVLNEVISAHAALN